MNDYQPDIDSDDDNQKSFNSKNLSINLDQYEAESNEFQSVYYLDNFIFQNVSSILFIIENLIYFKRWILTI